MGHPDGTSAKEVRAKSHSGARGERRRGLADPAKRERATVGSELLEN